jgi:hypothetical protein
MMNLSKMTLREQVLVLVVTIVIIGGVYGWLRFYPANKAISDIKKNTEMMEVALKTGKIPEEPFDDAGTLQNDLATLEVELNDATELMAAVNKRLSPPDTTAVRLAISDVARNSLVRIINNEEYRVTLPLPVGASPSEKVAVQPQKRLGDAAQRRARNERRAARMAGAALSVNQVSPEQAMPLARKMAINGPMERPMQRVVIEGTFAGMMRFIESLKGLDIMVTVVQLQLVPTPQAPPPGYNQSLSATMVLAL